MNLNELAKEISLLEGGKQNLSIAQIKEVIRCLSVIQYKHDFEHTTFVNKVAQVTKQSLFWKLMVNGAKHVKKAKRK